MPDNRNRKRPIQVKFFVDERELGLIKMKMAQLGIAPACTPARPAVGCTFAKW